MSGPPYPPPDEGPGSNAIGSFTIGISPIGDIPPFNFWTTVISQYANSPILTGLIESFNDAMDMTENMDNFYDMIWNVLTAEGYGLDVWGRIVVAPRTIALPTSPLSGPYFGFEEGAPSWLGFGSGGFFGVGGVPLTTNFVLSDAQFRLVVLAKAAKNISDGSIPSVNSILLALFPGRGACYVEDGLNMSLTYFFNFVLSPVELAIVQNAGVLPNPTGVVINVVHG